MSWKHYPRMYGEEPVAYVNDRNLARTIAGALAEHLNSKPVVWDDGQT